MAESIAGLVAPWGLVGIIIYVIILLSIGFLGWLKRRNNTADDFFLASRTLGLPLLVLTLFATQYSGNTLIGYAAQSYRVGPAFIVGILQLGAVAGAYLLFAPKLRRLASKFNFVTFGDYIQHRYNNRTLTRIISATAMLALINFVITNLIAVGTIAESLTGGALSYEWSIVIMATIIAIYNSLGGFRSVVWTDMLQGSLIAIGTISILILIFNDLGGIGEGFSRLESIAPELLGAPSLSDNITWISTLILVAFGASIYPHAIQRLYAPKNVKVLKQALAILAFLPFLVTFPAVIWGIFGRIYFPNLSNMESESITPLLVSELVPQSPFGVAFGLIFLCAVLAAIMSTIDSASLSFSASVVQDFVRIPEKRKVIITKIILWAMIAVAALIALSRPANIWQLLQLKFELLLPCLPALVLGLHWKRVNTKAIAVGFVAGIALTLLLIVGGWTDLIDPRPLGVHAGLWGLGLNVIAVVIVTLLQPKQKNPSNNTKQANNTNNIVLNG